SYGHRNSQGIAWDAQNQLYSVEHGDTGHDEINLIKPGANYGWPTIQGDQTEDGMVTPLLNSADETWAPSGAAILNDTLYFGELKGEALGKATFNGSKLTITHVLTNQYGRIRDVIIGPDHAL